MPPTPLVSVITINYRDAATTCALLDSIGANSYKNLEVILVDNGSLEDHTERFKTHFPEVNVIISNKNLGFAGGNNLGIAKAKGEYLFFVNNDTAFTPGLVESLITRLADKNIGAVSPKIRYFDQPDLVQYAGFTPVNPLTGRNQTIGEKINDQGQFDQARETPYAHGAAMMVPRAVIDKVGKMPEVYFLYYEELDWCEQIKKAGFDIWYEPAALIYHKESVSVNKISSLKTFFLTRNRILFMRRQATLPQLFLFCLFFSFITFPRWCLIFLIKNERKQLRAFYRGAFWHIRNGKNTPAHLEVSI